MRRKFFSREYRPRAYASECRLSRSHSHEISVRVCAGAGRCFLIKSLDECAHVCYTYVCVCDASAAAAAAAFSGKFKWQEICNGLESSWSGVVRV